MHRAIGYLSKRFVQIRAGEGQKVLLTFLYFFLVITAYYVIKPVSRSLVLGDLGSRFVPYIDLIVALLMGPMVSLFARLVDRFDKRWLVSGTFWAVAGCLVVFWRWLHWPTGWSSAAFYIWVSIFSVLVVTLFWLVANDLYHPREAKRLFGFIGSGGILGGIVGSYIAAIGARLIGTEQLLLVAVALLGICWIVVERLWRFVPASGPPERLRPSPSSDSSFAKLLTLFRELARSRYLVLLIGLVGIAKIVSTLIYYQFNPFIEQMFTSNDARTAFTSMFNAWMNVAAFVVQFFCTSWILRHLGLTAALLILPVGLLGGSVGLLFIPFFWLAASAELYDGSLNYSLQQTTKEVLYLPIDRSVRYKVKPFIDMVVFRFGKGLAALIGIICLNWWHLEARWLSTVTVPLIVVWLLLVLRLRVDYVKAIRTILQARAAARRGHDTVAAERQHHEATEHPGVLTDHLEAAAFGHPDVHEKLHLAGRLFEGHGVTSERVERLLETLAHYEQRHTADPYWHAPPPVEELKDCIHDPHEPMPKRREAIKWFAQEDGQEAVDALLGLLLVEEDTAMRHELLRGLTKLRVRHGQALEFPKRPIRRQVVKEVGMIRRLNRVVAIYRERQPQASMDEDPVLRLLRLLAEEHVQQLFRLLALLYRPEDILLIYNQLREPDTYIRADALELLDNLIDPALRWAIFPVLDEDRFLQTFEDGREQAVLDEKDAQEALRQGMWDHHGWLSVVIAAMIGRLRLQPLLPELERAASQSANPALSQAAQLARRLAERPASP